MKLLSKPDLKKSIAKENQELIDKNIRLRKLEREAIDRINSSKTDYSSDRLKAINDFEKFTAELSVKKSRSLKELNDINDEIERRKDIYYGLITKQDELEEREHLVGERESRVSLREQFVRGIEQKINDTVPQTARV